jgi:tetratricopeptide (TPR) repeat protein
MTDDTHTTPPWKSLSNLHEDEWARLQQILARFEHAWQQGEHPLIEDFLPKEEPEWVTLLVELIHLDLHYRIEAGQAVRVEHYLSAHDELLRFPDVVADLAVAEHALRRKREIDLAIENYLERFPACAEELRTRLGEATEHAAMASDTSVAAVVESEEEAPATSIETCPPWEGPIDGEATDDAAAAVTPGVQGRTPPDPFRTVVTTAPDGDSPFLPAGGVAAPATPRWPAIEGYDILGELGRGAMGIVYKARQQILNRVVALKVIRSQEDIGDNELARFYIEAEAIARLQHPNVLQIYEVGEHEDRPFLALEYCPGGTLAARVRGTTLSAKEAAETIEKVALGMEAAHQRKVLHRDIKPANVLLSASGEPKISDFGLAKKLDEVGRTLPNQVMGTPCYMPPEQAAGKIRDMGPTADVYSLAATLYELLTGRPPFKAASVMLTLYQVEHEDPASLRQLQPSVPRDLETICLKGLRKERSRRYQTAKELADDLRRFLDGKAPLARRASALERAARWARRKPAQAALVVMVFLLGMAVVAGAVLYGLYQRQVAIAEGQKSDALNREIERQSKEIELQRKVDKLWREGLAAEHDAMAAQERKKPTEAESYFTVAVERFKDIESAFALDPAAGNDDLLREVRVALTRVRGALDAEAQRQRHEATRKQLQDDARRFFDARAEVVDHEVDPLVGDRAANSQRVSSLAAGALKHLGLKMNATSAEAAENARRWRDLDSEQGARLLGSACSEVLLLWAEAEGVPLPGAAPQQQVERARRGLALLEVAGALQKTLDLPPMRAYHERKARLLDRIGEAAAAQQARQTAKQLTPQTALDHFLGALDLYQENRFQDAAEECRRALEQQPEYPGAVYLRAVCRFQTGKWGEAQVGLSGYLTRRPDSFEARALRASALGLIDQFDLAEEDFALAWPKAKLDAEKYAVLANRGVMRTRRGRWEEAHARAENKPEVVAQRRLLARLDEAEPDLKQAREIDPRSWKAHASLAVIYLERQEWQKAADEATSAVEHKPPQPELAGLYRIRGRARVHLGDHIEGRKDFTAAINERGGKASAELASDLVDRGRSFFKTGDASAARKDAEEALRADPHYAPAFHLHAEALLQIAEFETKVGPDRDALLAVAGRALDGYLAAKGPPTAAIFKARGLIHKKQNQPGEALAAFSEALKLQPEDGETWRLRGWVNMQLALPARALADFETALKKGDKEVDTLHGKGNARAVLGRLPQALEDARAALNRPNLKAEDLLAIAAIYARAAAHVSAGPAARSPQKQQEIATYQDGAVGLVIKALQRCDQDQQLAFWQQHVKDEPAFTGLRTHPTWKALAGRFAP